MVSSLISALTKNEDLRQDLWVAYLSGEINSTFSDKLYQLSLSYDIQKQSTEKLQQIIDLDIPQSNLDQLSDLQKSILLLTILGYSPEQIGKYNSIKQVIIEEEMVDLTKHPVWAYGIKEKSKSRRKIRSY